MYRYTIPRFLPWLFPQVTWHNDRQEPMVHLTFDDGPEPEVTPWVLDTLDRFKARGTFFCVGENIKNHPELFKEIIDRGHAVGNHTYNHLNGWKTSMANYVENVDLCQTLMVSNGVKWKTRPFMRPPYGRIKPMQICKLLPDFKIIMWDVLTCDFLSTVQPELSLKASIEATRYGSIVIFHDSLKAKRNLTYILPRYLEYFSERDCAFSCL